MIVEFFSQKKCFIASTATLCFITFLDNLMWYETTQLFATIFECNSVYGVSSLFSSIIVFWHLMFHHFFRILIAFFACFTTWCFFNFSMLEIFCHILCMLRHLVFYEFLNVKNRFVILCMRKMYTRIHCNFLFFTFLHCLQRSVHVMCHLFLMLKIVFAHSFHITATDFLTSTWE